MTRDANTGRKAMNLEAMAKEARPVNDADWGSERQIEAENRFYEKALATMGGDDRHDFEMWALKATSEEAIEEAIKLCSPFLRWRSDRKIVADLSAVVPDEGLEGRPGNSYGDLHIEKTGEDEYTLTIGNWSQTAPLWDLECILWDFATRNGHLADSWVCEHGSRRLILRWLAWNDSNGVYTDEDREEEGDAMDRLTYDEALALMRAQMEGSK